MYFVIVLMTGLLLGERPGRIAGLACVALGFGLLMAERFHLLPPAVRYSSTGMWLLSCLYIGVVITLLRLPTMMIRTALRHANADLSEKKLAQEQLLENQRLLQTMIEYAPAAVARDGADAGRARSRRRSGIAAQRRRSGARCRLGADALRPAARQLSHAEHRSREAPCHH